MHAIGRHIVLLINLGIPLYELITSDQVVS